MFSLLILIVLLLTVTDTAAPSDVPADSHYKLVNFRTSSPTNAAYISNFLDGNNKPLNLNSGDFDEDGVPDLVCAYGNDQEGALVIYRGNIKSISSKLSDFGKAPFLETRVIIFSPEPPDFVITGDFDADAHQDIAVGRIGSKHIYFFRGNGKAKFEIPKTINVPGELVTLIEGEVNRPDGLIDVIAAISDKQGNSVLVYENPQGALSGVPEIFPLPDVPTRISVARWDEDHYLDLAIATVKDIHIIHGRDRKLSLDAHQRTTVPVLKQSQHSFSTWTFQNGPLQRDFKTINPQFKDAIAIHPMRLNADAIPDFVVFFNGKISPEVFLTVPNSVFVVSNTDDSGIGSLRQAIIDANSTPGVDSIEFNIPGTSPFTISVASPLPEITEGVTIDGTSQPGFAGEPIVELNGDAAGIFANGLTITGGDSTVKGLIINRFGTNGFASGIVLNTNGGNFIEGNFIGTDSTGTLDLGNTGWGILMYGSPNNIIGGTFTSARNVISGNGAGNVEVEFGSTMTVIQGNLIGTDKNGTSIIEGQAGISVFDTSVIIGGTEINAGNVISGNNYGITVNGEGTIIQGNLIGTDITGSSDPGFSGTGMQISNSTLGGVGNLIGGTTPAARNLISGNSLGAFILSDSNLVQGNFIGTDISGTTSIANDTGIDMVQSNNVIGGAVSGSGNIISGNSFIGILIRDFGTGNQVQRNFIGTDVTGTSALGNFFGIVLANSENLIGGSWPDTSNVVSGNQSTGIYVSSEAFFNSIQGNLIGTQLDGVTALGNGGDGIDVFGFLNIIGGNDPAQSNTVAYNQQNGVSIFGLQNSILNNQILLNGALGIDLGGDGVTPNDFNDSDEGANNLQNFPIISEASFIQDNTEIHGSLNSLPEQTFRIEFYLSDVCDESGFGEGKTFLGSANVSTDDLGNNEFAISFPTEPLIGQFITATATDANNNTSEFSQCVVVTDCPFINIGPSSLPEGEVNVPYEQTITAEGGTSPYVFSVTEGSLPFGVDLNPDTGELAGTPFSEGQFNFVITVTDANNCSVRKNYFLTINPGCPAIFLFPYSLSNSVVGEPYSETIFAFGGIDPYTFSVSSGTLPPGLTLDSLSGVLSGIPTASGEYTFTIEASDSNDCKGSQVYNVNICLFCDDFADSILNPEWNYIKPSWSESDGVLLASPQKQKAFATTGQAFSGCSICNIETSFLMLGGKAGRLTLHAWYVDELNGVELLIKEDLNKWELSQRVGGVIVAQREITKDIALGFYYKTVISYDGNDFHVSVDGENIMNLSAVGSPMGIIGFEVKQTTALFEYIIVN